MLRIFLLTLACFIWGLGFVGTRWTLDVYDPFWSNSLRFVFAAILSAPVLIYRKSFKISFGAFVCGICLLLALQLQTIGIEITTLAKSGFLTAFYAIFTPIFGMIFYSHHYRKTYWALVSSALIGIAFLCDLDWKSFNQGDGWVLASAVFFSLHIMAVDYFGQGSNALDFNFQQIIVMAVFGAGLTYIFNGPTDLTPLLNWSDLLRGSPLTGFLIVSIFSSMLAFSIQVYAQQGTPTHIVSLIFLSESVFSALFGVLLFDEFLNLNGVFGATIVMLSVALIPFVTRYKKKSLPDEETL
jgi:drug/metabolite transporter (DMT)-like permease